MIDERLEGAIVRTHAKLLILDPIQAYLGGGMDMNRANEARDMTKRLGHGFYRFLCSGKKCIAGGQSGRRVEYTSCCSDKK